MEHLARACAQGQVPARVVSVVCNRADAPGLARAQALDLPVHLLPHAGFDSREAYDQALARLLEGLAPDLIVLAGFMRILSPGFVRQFSGRLVNIHPSLLPAFPGTRTHERAIAAGVLVHGATVHLVTEALDQGPILAQAVVRVWPGDDADRLAARVLSAEHGLYCRAVRWLLEDRVTVQADRVVIEGVDPADRLVMNP
jgi:phosphoribosylglycinamide formyltransferase-1